jgi:hypothetical protein
MKIIFFKKLFPELQFDIIKKIEKINGWYWGQLHLSSLIIFDVSSLK